MPDEPAPVGGLVTSPDLASPIPIQQQDEVSAGVQGAWAPRSQALEETHRRELLEAIHTPIVTTSMTGRINGFNAAAIAMFGSPARLYGRNIRHIIPFVADPQDSSMNAEAQGRLADATGRTLDLEVSRTVMGEEDEQGYAVYIVHDISRHAEVNRLREQLLYSVAHELRGPLMVLDNALEILDGTDYPALTREEYAHVLSTARRSSLRMRTLMEDMLTAGNIQSGHFVVAPHRTDLQLIVDDALDVVGPPISARGQQVAIDLPQECRQVLADKRYTRQVLTNLLANASKYSPERSVIRVLAANTGTMVRISVDDQGQGMSPEQQAGLFERFYRVRTDTEAPGVGLGLAIAKGIVEAHGGSIGVDSQLGSGTSVWFTLPAANRQG